MWMKVGIDPRRSSSVCNFTAALVERNGAHGNIDRHRSMVVASRAYTVLYQAAEWLTLAGIHKSPAK